MRIFSGGRYGVSERSGEGVSGELLSTETLHVRTCTDATFFPLFMNFGGLVIPNKNERKTGSKFL